MTSLSCCDGRFLYSVVIELDMHKAAFGDVTDGCHKHRDCNAHMGAGL